jgi:coproporphyrinogen III oxidase-like Fe-S oxidoreductase
VRRWAKALSNGERELELYERLTSEQIYLETIMLGLRMTEGLLLSQVKPSEALDGFLHDGFLKIEGDRLKPTPKGLLVADALARSLS